MEASRHQLPMKKQLYDKLGNAIN